MEALRAASTKLDKAVEQGRHPQEPGGEPQVGDGQAGRLALTRPRPGGAGPPERRRFAPPGSRRRRASPRPIADGPCASATGHQTRQACVKWRTSRVDGARGTTRRIASRRAHAGARGRRERDRWESGRDAARAAAPAAGRARRTSPRSREAFWWARPRLVAACGTGTADLRGTAAQAPITPIGPAAALCRAGRARPRRPRQRPLGHAVRRRRPRAHAGPRRRGPARPRPARAAAPGTTAAARLRRPAQPHAEPHAGPRRSPRQARAETRAPPAAGARHRHDGRPRPRSCAWSTSSGPRPAASPLRSNAVLVSRRARPQP